MKKKIASKRSKAITRGKVAFASKHVAPKKKAISKKKSAKKRSDIRLDNSTLNKKIAGIPITDIDDRQPRQTIPSHRQPRQRSRKKRKPSRK